MLVPHPYIPNGFRKMAYGHTIPHCETIHPADGPHTYETMSLRLPSIIPVCSKYATDKQGEFFPTRLADDTHSSYTHSGNKEAFFGQIKTCSKTLQSVT